MEEKFANLNISDADPTSSSLAMYSSEKNGCDETGDGSKAKPFKTALQAMRKHGKEPFPDIYVDAKEESQKYELIAKSQLKKLTKMWKEECKKMEARLKKEKEDAEKRAIAIQEAKKIQIKQDPSLPEAKTIKICEGKNYRGQRVKICGWVHRLRRQGKNMMFIVLRDGTDYLQCILLDKLCQTYEAIILNVESTVALYGTLLGVPEGKEAPGGHELQVDFWELIGESPAGGIEAEINKEAHPDVQLDKRHLQLRGENTAKVGQSLSLQ